MIQEKIQNIFEQVTQLSSLQQKHWLAKILQEVALYYQAFSQENQFGDFSFFDKTLQIIENATPQKSEIRALRQLLEQENMIPDTEEYGTLAASLCINSCVVADYILQFLENKSTETLKNIIESHFEIAQMLYGQDLEANLRGVVWEVYLCAKPDFIHFLQLQEENLQTTRSL